MPVHSGLAELVGGQGAFLLREKNCYRIKEDDWRKMKERDDIDILKKTESRDGSKINVEISFDLIEGRLSGWVYVVSDQEEVKVVASLKIGDSGGSLEMKNYGKFSQEEMVFEEGYKAEEFIKKNAKDGFVTVTVNLEISKHEESIKPALE
jgi:hypothetical protein